MIPLNAGGTAPLPVQRSQSHTLDETQQRRLKLRKATQAFEAIFITQLLRNMRSVSFTPDREDGFGKDMMLAMADEGVARQLARSGMFGVGEILYNHLVRRLDASSDAQEPLRITMGRRLEGVEPVRQAASAALGSSHSPASDKLSEYFSHIREAAQKNNLPEELIRAVILTESSGQRNAISRKGALGLMQLMPDTARALGVKNPLEPRENILGGTKYLRSLLDRFKDLKTALAAYNAGPGTVERFGGIPPYTETQNYIERVLSQLSNSQAVNK